MLWMQILPFLILARSAILGEGENSVDDAGYHKENEMVTSK